MVCELRFWFLTMTSSAWFFLLNRLDGQSACPLTLYSFFVRYGFCPIHLQWIGQNPPMLQKACEWADDTLTFLLSAVLACRKRFPFVGNRKRKHRTVHVAEQNRRQITVFELGRRQIRRAWLVGSPTKCACLCVSGISSPSVQSIRFYILRTQ